jgi:hypothetical protein
MLNYLSLLFFATAAAHWLGTLGACGPIGSFWLGDGWFCNDNKIENVWNVCVWEKGMKPVLDTFAVR